MNKLLELWLQKCELFMIDEEGLHYCIHEGGKGIDLFFKTESSSYSVAIPDYYHDCPVDDETKIFIYLVVDLKCNCKVWFEPKEGGPSVERVFHISEANPFSILAWIQEQHEVGAFGVRPQKQRLSRELIDAGESDA